MRVESVSRWPPLAVDGAQIAARVTNGEIIVIHGLLQAIGWLPKLVDICRSELAALVGAARAESVIGASFAALHDQLSVEELFAFNRAAMRHLVPVAPLLIKDFAQHVLQRRGTYAECYPNLRTLVPHDVAARNAAAFDAQHRVRGAGKITPHGPHYDSWHRHPLNTINLWCALGQVREGNGMLVYPEMWGKHLPSDSHGRIRRDQVLGRALNFALDPGDAVVFSANHLHGSELNRTKETRCVISLRMTLERPQFPAEHAYAYVYSDWVATVLDRWSRVPVQLSRGFIEDRAARFVKRWRRPARAPAPGPSAGFPANGDTSRHAPPTIDTAWADGGTLRLIRADFLPLNQIRPVDADWCASRTASGYRLFSRACPHEGADLALGHVTRDGRIACPWHNLSFDCSTGQSPCRSIAPLSVAPGEVEGATVRFAVAR